MSTTDVKMLTNTATLAALLAASAAIGGILMPDILSPKVMAIACILLTITFIANAVVVILSMKATKKITTLTCETDTEKNGSKN